jgi:hypothetical protein
MSWTADPVMDKTPPHLAGSLIAKMYENAKSEADIRKAEALWAKYKEKIVRDEKSAECGSYGAKGDKEIAMSIVDDLLERPVSLMVAVGNLILAIGKQENGEVVGGLSRCPS